MYFDNDDDSFLKATSTTLCVEMIAPPKKDHSGLNVGEWLDIPHEQQQQLLNTGTATEGIALHTSTVRDWADSPDATTHLKNLLSALQLSPSPTKSNSSSSNGETNSTPSSSSPQPCEISEMFQQELASLRRLNTQLRAKVMKLTTKVTHERNRYEPAKRELAQEQQQCQQEKEKASKWQETAGCLQSQLELLVEKHEAIEEHCDLMSFLKEVVCELLVRQGVAMQGDKTKLVFNEGVMTCEVFDLFEKALRRHFSPAEDSTASCNKDADDHSCGTDVLTVLQLCRQELKLRFIAFPELPEAVAFLKTGRMDTTKTSANTTQHVVVGCLVFERQQNISSGDRCYDGCCLPLFALGDESIVGSRSIDPSTWDDLNIPEISTSSPGPALVIPTSAAIPSTLSATAQSFQPPFQPLHFHNPTTHIGQFPLPHVAVGQQAAPPSYSQPTPPTLYPQCSNVPSSSRPSITDVQYFDDDDTWQSMDAVVVQTLKQRYDRGQYSCILQVNKWPVSINLAASLQINLTTGKKRAIRIV